MAQGTVMRMRSQMGWGKYAGKTVAWIFDNDPNYLRWCYFNLKKCRWKGSVDDGESVCLKLGLRQDIRFEDRKKHYNINQ